MQAAASTRALHARTEESLVTAGTQASATTAASMSADPRVSLSPRPRSASAQAKKPRIATVRANPPQSTSTDESMRSSTAAHHQSARPEAQATAAQSWTPKTSSGFSPGIAGEESADG